MHPLARARIERLALTQAQLAGFTKISVSTIQRAEAGKRIRLDCCRQICDYFSEQYDRKVEPRELGLVYEEEQNDELYMEQRNISEQDTESEGTMKRRDVLLGLAAVGVTAATVPHEVQNLLQSTESLSAKPFKISGKTLSEVEYLTRHCWQYLPFVANVVEEDYLFFAKRHLRMLWSLLGGSPSSSIDKYLYSYISETAQVVGMLLYSLKRHAEAKAFLSLAVEYAQKAGNDALRAVALGRMGNFLIDTGRANEALDPLEVASRVAQGSATATVRSWIAASEGDALANIGQASDCDKALGRAEDIGSQMSSGLDLYHTPFDDSWFFGYKGACYGRLGRPHDARNAQAALKQALKFLDPTYIFRQSPLLRDLAIAYSLDKNIEEACRIAGQAVNLAEQTNAPMELQRVQDFSQQYLKKWKDYPVVKDLNDKLRTVQKKLEGA